MSPGAALERLATPAALVDLDVVERNVQRMDARMRRLGVELRPHVKTHKCVEIGRLQAPDGRITVSTLAEARHFAAAGFGDITWALPLPLGRLPEAMSLAAEIERFDLLIDHPAALAAIESFVDAEGGRPSVLLKVDCGYHRAGVDPESAEAVELALAMARSPAIGFAGILTHAGHAYGCRGAAELAAAAEEERRVMADFAAELRRRGVSVPRVSVGSTPTMTRARDLTGVSEARPGNYVFFDRYQAAIGACEPGDVALTVLATVIGCTPDRGRLLVDAGALALSKDLGATHVEGFGGYGELQALDGTPLGHLELVALSQEHGHLVCRSPELAARHPVGSKLRVVPNHSCLTAALHERYHALRGGEVVARWSPVRGW